MKSKMIQIGNFFFTYRNKLFPLIIITLFLTALPPLQLFGSQKLELSSDVISLLLIFFGLAVRGIVIGYAYIKRGGLNKKVYAENLVTEGMFSLCRNPLYFGNMLIYCGVFLMHGNPYVIIFGISLYFFIYQCIIYAEENYLETKFGVGYKQYCRDVPRWIPQISKFRTATQGMNFNFRRAIIKDYSTIATSIITVCIIALYEHMSLATVAGHLQHLVAIGLLMAITVACALTLRVLKKRHIITDKV